MTTTSPLVQRAIIAATAEMDSDVELFGVPVDLPGRAVVFVTAPIRLVIKVDEDPTRLLREKDATTRLAGVVPVAAHWFTVESDYPEPWILATSYIDGDRISATSSDSAWEDLGRQLAKIHTLRVSGASTEPTDSWESHGSNPASANKWATQLATKARDAGLVDEKTATAFLTQTITETEPDRAACLIHGELTPDHVLCDGDQVSGLIDLGDCGLGDPAYDLATATLWNADKLTQLLVGYSDAGGPISRASPELEADIRRFQLMRLITGALWLHTYEFTTTPYISELYERLVAGLPDS